jgi:hypothetical protein
MIPVLFTAGAGIKQGAAIPNSIMSEPMAGVDDLNPQRFYHGTKADLKPGDLIEPGYNSNYGERKKAAYVYLTATLDAATWGANWPSARDLAESTSWSRRGRLKTTLA